MHKLATENKIMERAMRRKDWAVKEKLRKERARKREIKKKVLGKVKIWAEK